MAKKFWKLLSVVSMSSMSGLISSSEVSSLLEFVFFASTLACFGRWSFWGIFANALVSVFRSFFSLSADATAAAKRIVLGQDAAAAFAADVLVVDAVAAFARHEVGAVPKAVASLLYLEGLWGSFLLLSF